MNENTYQGKLIKKIPTLFPEYECIVLKNDSHYQQGIPDLTILIDDWYATLEVKRSKNAKRQPNQEYFVDKINGMSFAAVIYPENEEEVLYELQQAFSSRRRSRISKS